MNDQGILMLLQSKGLNAWQAKFVASFLDDESARFQLLTGSSGTGKTEAGIAIASELALKGNKRILVLAPAILCEEWRARLSDPQLQAPVFLITRQVYRELEATVNIGESPWNLKSIYVISIDLAKRSDFAASLSGVAWDLVIVDEAHFLSSRQRSALLNRLIDANAILKLLLMTATPLQPITGPFIRLKSPMTITNWSGDLLNWDGTIVERPQVELKVIPYTRGKDEIQFLSKLFSQLPNFEIAVGINRLLITFLMQRASSSLIAIDQSLQRMNHKLKITDEEAGSLLDKEIEDLMEDDIDSEQIESKIGQIPLESTDMQFSLAVVEQCLEEIDKVNSDEKLEIVKNLIRSIIAEQTEGDFRLCIFSMYTDTVSYLSLAMEDLGIPLFKITGAQTFAERQEIVSQFRKFGGLLIGTDRGLSEGIDLTEVTNVIHYDIPSQPMFFEQRRGRFDRYGRITPCKMYILKDESGVLPFELQLIKLITSQYSN